MKPSRVQSVLRQMLSQNWPVFIWGPPGVGKSSVVRTVAQELSLSIIDLRASLLDPTDLRGIPAVIGNRAIWCPPDFLPTANDPPGILFLDELNAAPPIVQTSMYQLVLDRRVGEYSLPDGWKIVAAGNRLADRSLVFRLSSALANRFIHIDYETDIEDWRSWAIKYRIHPHIVSFLAIRPELLMQQPDDSVAYPTPRSWQMVSDIIGSYQNDIASCRDIIPGVIGEAAAVEFAAWVDSSLREKDLQNLVENPTTAKLPKKLNELFAVTSWFAYHSNMESIRAAGAVLLTRLPVEFAVILARDLLRASPTLISDPGYKAFIKLHGKLFID